jgi:monoamine oxidase
VVTGIEHSADQVVVRTEGGETFTAEYAVVTLPLGLLKNGAVAFTPALPEEKAAAIDSMVSWQRRGLCKQESGSSPVVTCG